MSAVHMRRFIINALLMTVSSLALRFIAVIFNTYISRTVGAEGMGLFTLVTSVYSLAVTVAVSGVSLASTTLCARAARSHSRMKIMRCALLWSACFGLISTLLLMLSAPFIGETLLCDIRTVTPIRIFSVSLCAISISSALGGYFTAVRRTYKSVAVQISEQLIRIAATSLLLMLVSGGGVGRMCCALVAGGAAAELIAAAMSALMYAVDIKRSLHHENAAPLSQDSSTTKNAAKTHIELDEIADGAGLSRFAGIALPVAVSAYARSALLTVEHILIPRGLRRYGASSAASLASYGILCGMVLPVIFFPSAFLCSLPTLLVPELAESSARGDEVRIDRIVTKIFRLTIIFSAGVSAIMLCFSYELGIALYDSAEAALYIKLLAPLIPVMYLDTVTDGMLKGLGEQVYNMRVNIADSALSALLVWLVIPKTGVPGYIIVIYITELMNASLSITKLITMSRFGGISPVKAALCWAGLPFIFAVGAVSAAKIIISLFPPLPIVPSLVLSITAASLIYAALSAMANSDLLPHLRKSRGEVRELFEKSSAKTLPH